MNQLDLFARSESAPVPPPAERAFKRSDADALLEALKRDLATLAGPETYIAFGDRAFYEERIADYRARLRGIIEDSEEAK